MFHRIAHVCLNVKNLERSLEYYGKLGFVTKFRFTRKGAPFGAYLEIADGSYIEVFEDTTLDKVDNRGIAHFCLETDDLDGMMAELRDRGVAYTEKRLGCDDTYQIWLCDPDGNQFEVHQYTPKSRQRLGGVVEADW